MERLPTWGPRDDAGWDVEEYYGLLERGILTERDHVELLEGVIVAGEPQNPPHASTVWRIQHLLERVLGDRAIVRVQLDYIAGRRSAPEPDVAVVPLVPDEYASAHPSRAHVVFEIADSSLLQDRLTKGPIYAKNGVPQYVLVNLRDRTIENHTRPSAPRRRYLDRVVLERGARLELVAFPDVSLAVDALLGVRSRR
jgi:Uma2 family endonuclease